MIIVRDHLGRHLEPETPAHPPRRWWGLGDVVEKLAHPIAKALKLRCLDPETNRLRPESPCAKRRDWLNRLGQPKSAAPVVKPPRAP